GSPATSFPWYCPEAHRDYTCCNDYAMNPTGLPFRPTAPSAPNPWSKRLSMRYTLRVINGGRICWNNMLRTIKMVKPASQNFSRCKVSGPNWHKPLLIPYPLITLLKEQGKLQP